MNTEKVTRLIEKIFNDNKPKGIDKISLEFYLYDSESSDRFVITPTYVVENDDSEEYLKPIWFSNTKSNYRLKNEKHLLDFEEEMKYFVTHILGFKFHYSGRGITKKDFFEKQKTICG